MAFKLSAELSSRKVGLVGMKIILSFILFTMLGTEVLFDFEKGSDLSSWRIVDDVVMGGRSSGKFSLNDAGHSQFEGKVSLENNGGFSSVRYRPETIEVKKFSKVLLRIKGDGKRYQFRIKSNISNYYSYIHYFETSGEWETVELPFAEFYPTYRGRNLDMPNYDGQFIDEISVLIANSKPQSFQLALDHISLK